MGIRQATCALADEVMVSQDCGTRCVMVLTGSSRGIHDCAKVRVDGISGGVVVPVTYG